MRRTSLSLVYFTLVGKSHDVKEECLYDGLENYGAVLSLLMVHLELDELR